MKFKVLIFAKLAATIFATTLHGQTPPKVTPAQIKGTFTDGQMLKSNGTDSIQAASNLKEDTDTVYVDKFLNVDTATLYVDASNNKVGIGTSSPQGFLSIEQDFPSSLTLGLTVSDFNYTGLFQVKTNSSAKFIPAFEGYAGNELVSGNKRPLGVSLIGAIDTILDSSFGTDALIIIQGREYDDFPNGFGAVENAPILAVNNFATNLLRIEADGGIFAPSLGSGSAAQSVYYDTGTDEIFYVSSSIRYKENVEDLPIGLNDLLKLRPATYKYKSNGNKDYGFIAEEVYDAGLEEFVTFNEDGQIEGLKDNYFTVLSIKAIQEQQAIIEIQATEIETLKTQIQLILNEIEEIKNN